MSTFDVQAAEQSLREAEHKIREARRGLSRARQLATMVHRSEPANGKVIKFEGTFKPGAATYWFTAIRCDHYRGDRRWFVSMNNDHPNPRMLRSPATWTDLVEFAMPGSIAVASNWVAVFQEGSPGCSDPDESEWSWNT